MADESGHMMDLAGAVADGTPVDWDAAESSASNDSEREQIRRMRLVQQIASADASGDSHAPVAPDDAPPAAWGPLRVIERIGRGRFGNVYRAFDPRLDREVALKLLRRRESVGADVESAVIEEGRLLARVRHPNVVTVHGADRIDGRVGLWMELVRGHTLQEELVARGPFTPLETVEAGVDVCSALQSVHRAGLVHRDVKAQNVMRDDDGRLVLMDFGTGRELDVEQPPELAGTPLYLPPEVIEGAPSSPASDIYGAGVLLYHLATGSFPVHGRTLGEIRAAHARGDRADADSALAGMPASLASVIGRALAVQRDRRFGSAADMAAALASCRAKLAPSPVPPGRQLSRVRRVMFVGALALAGVTALFSWRGAGAGGSTGGSLAPVLICERCGGVWASVSDDGRLMVTGGGEGGGFAVRDLATGQITTGVATGGGAPGKGSPDFPLFSPDSRRLAYTWWPDAEGRAPELRIAPARPGGAPVVVASEPRLLGPLAWAPDGSRILILLQNDDRSSQFAWASTSDGTLTEIKSLGWRFLPPEDRARVSPDGQSIVYSALANQPARSWPYRPADTGKRVYLLAADGSREIELTQGAGISEAAIWSPDGARVVYTSNIAGSVDLWAQAVTDGMPDGAPVLIRKDIGSLVPFIVSRDGELFFHVGRLGVKQSRIADLSKRAALDPAIISGWRPVWSPDGRSIAVMRPRPPEGQTSDLMVRSVETGAERIFEHPGFDGWPPMWFGDSTSVLKLLSEEGAQWWTRIGVADGRFTQVMRNREDPRAQTHFNIRTLAPDGRSLFFGAYVKPKLLDRIVAVDVARGTFRAVFQLPGGPDSWPRAAQEFTISASPDGGHLAVMHRDPKSGLTRLGRVAVDGTGYRELCPPFLLTTVRNKLAWTADGASIFFAIDHGDNAHRVMKVAATGGEPVFTGLEVRSLDAFDVSPDGSRIVFSSLHTIGARSELWKLDVSGVLRQQPDASR